jgi:hypothetical protein
MPSVSWAGATTTAQEDATILTGIFEIDTATYEQTLRFTANSGGNLLVFGQAGIGKTEIPSQIARELGLPWVYWNLSTQEAPDLVGLPTIREESVQNADTKARTVRVVEYAAPPYMPVMEYTPDPVMILIDEIDKAKSELQNPLLEVLQQRTINGRPLNVKCIVCTGNLPDEGAFSKPVSHALTNRCQVFKLTTCFDAWQSWAVKKGVNSLVVGFLSRNQEYLSRAPVVGDPTAYVRCSPRSWTLAAQDLDFTDSSASVDFQTLLVAGRVGMEPAAQFRVWLDHYRFIEPMLDALVTKGEVPNLAEMTIDRLLVLGLSACSAVASMGRKPVKNQAERDKQHTAVNTAAVNVFKMISRIPSEFQVHAIKSALSIELVSQYQLTKIPDVMKTYLNVRRSMK